MLQTARVRTVSEHENGSVAARLVVLVVQQGLKARTTSRNQDCEADGVLRSGRSWQCVTQAHGTLRCRVRLRVRHKHVRREGQEVGASGLIHAMHRQRIGGPAVDRLQTVDEIVEHYCVASTPGKSRLYVGLGTLFLAFAVIGIWIPGWPTVSWAVPAAFLFSLSSERMFRKTLTNPYFGAAMFEYYASGKTVSQHAKYVTVGFIALMASLSAYFVWYVSTRGEGVLTEPATWNGADPGFGVGTIILVGIIGMWYVGFKVPTRK